MDFLKEEKKELPKDKLAELAELSYKQTRLEGDIEEVHLSLIQNSMPEFLPIKVLEEMLNLQKKKLQKIKQESIPTLMNELGISELTLSTGQKVSIKDVIKPSITKANIHKVYKAMVKIEYNKTIKENENEPLDELYARKLSEQKIKDLFKNNLVMEYTDEWVTFFLKEEVSFEQNLSIHPSTLKKYCKDKLEAGEALPEGISVFQYQETKIK